MKPETSKAQGSGMSRKASVAGFAIIAVQNAQTGLGDSDIPQIIGIVGIALVAIVSQAILDNRKQAGPADDISE